MLRRRVLSGLAVAILFALPLLPEILGSRRLPYADLVKRGDEPAITRLMEDQHKGMLLEVKRGRFDPGGDRTVIEDLSLDEIVLAYLASRVAAK